VARRYLYGQAAVLLLAAAIATYVAKATHDDFRQTGIASLSGVTVRGCVLVAAALATGSACFAVCAHQITRQRVLATRAALALEVMFVTALVAPVGVWFSEPAGIVAWCLCAACATGAVVKLLGHPAASN
jgi:hypothetical protein